MLQLLLPTTVEQDFVHDDPAESPHVFIFNSKVESRLSSNAAPQEAVFLRPAIPAIISLRGRVEEPSHVSGVSCTPSHALTDSNCPCFVFPSSFVLAVHVLHSNRKVRQRPCRSALISLVIIVYKIPHAGDVRAWQVREVSLAGLQQRAVSRHNVPSGAWNLPPASRRRLTCEASIRSSATGLLLWPA